METNKTEDLESKIITAARELFTENGFAETSMSDIAAKVGINRPVLHYYFRTKDRMFRAVFGSIVEALIPKVQDIVRDNGLSVARKVSLVVDAYYKIFTASPCLPMFIMREMHRDFKYVEDFVLTMRFDRYFKTIGGYITEEMDKGYLRRVPLRFLFLSFYSMLTMPFSMKNLCQHRLLNEGESFDDMLAEWKPYIVSSITTLLTPDNAE